MDDSLPFSQLNNDVFRNYIMKHSYALNESDLMKLRNLIFNPFSLSGHEKSHLMLNSDLDPDHNYYNATINYIDTCDHHDEDSFKRMAKGSAYTDFSILHLNIRSIMSKFDDFKAYLRSLEHEFLLYLRYRKQINTNNTLKRKFKRLTLCE